MATTDRDYMDGGMAAALERITDPDLGKTEEPEGAAGEAEEQEDPREQEDADDESGEPDPADADDDDDESAEADGSEEDDSEQDDDSDSDVDDDEDKGAQYFTVKVDGKEEQVTLEDLKRGYSGQKYVQQGMDQAAKARKQAEDVYSALMSERQQLAQLLQGAQTNGTPQPPQPPSKDMFKSDPIGFMEAKIEYDEKLQEYHGQMQQYQQVLSQQTESEKRARDAYLQQQAQDLKSKVPELADKKKAARLQEQIRQVGTEVYGYTPEELGQVMDHRAIRVLIDAAKYHQIRKGKDSAQEVVQKRKTKVARPGARPPQNSATSRDKQLRQKKARLKRSGSINDALGLVLQRE